MGRSASPSRLGSGRRIWGSGEKPMQAVLRRLLPDGHRLIEGLRPRFFRKVSGGVSPPLSLGPLSLAVSGEGGPAPPIAVNWFVGVYSRPMKGAQREARGLSGRRLHGRNCRSIAAKVVLCYRAAVEAVSQGGLQIGAAICAEKAQACRV